MNTRMTENPNFLKLQGAKILAEANDLKRTVEALAKDIGLEPAQVQNVVDGKATWEVTQDVLTRMGRTYPIDSAELSLIEDDSRNGVRVMRASESAASGRVFSRKNRSGERTPYYEYRDTAMSKVGPFKPEWIKELRNVTDSDPNNPDVIYNNGHFLHQMTFFIGPVNFYWEVNGKRFCREMDTGDSNYITPFWPHSFANRDPSREAIIIAVTYGGEVKRTLRELYALGPVAVTGYKLDSTTQASGHWSLILQHLRNENLSLENFSTRLRNQGALALAQKVLESAPDEFDLAELTRISDTLNIELSDLLLPENVAGNEVIVKKKDPSDSYLFPNSNTPAYRINSLARCQHMASVKGFDLEVLRTLDLEAFDLNSSLHNYVYNYGTSPVGLSWRKNGRTEREVLNPGDSVYIQPFVEHGFTSMEATPGKLAVVRAAGAVSISVQRELSTFASIKRIIESDCWFN